MNLKDIYKKIDTLNESVNMSISMSGETADDVATLMKMVKDAGGKPEVIEPMPKLSPRDDIEKSIAILDKPEGPKDMEPMGKMELPPMAPDADDKGGKGEPCGICGKTHETEITASLCAADNKDAEAKEGEWDNAPDEKYQDTAYMQNDLAGGLNRQKKSYPKVAGGDNPMALEDEIKSELAAKLAEKLKGE
tara:strand:+ start:7938 stop:8513 length:576 start_codon:yes stop_codon:yes gene_type:complete